MDLNTVLLTIGEIRNNLCDKLEEFSESLSEISTSPTNQSVDGEPLFEPLGEIYTSSTNQYVDDNERCHLRNLYDNIQPSLQTKVEHARKIIQEHYEILKQKQLEVKHLEEMLKQKESEYENVQKNIVKSKKHLEKYEEKQKALQNLEDCIRTYKLLTQTHFAYNKEGYTTGYIKTKNPLDFEVFEFNHSQISQEDILKEMWSLLEKVSEETQPKDDVKLQDGQ